MHKQTLAELQSGMERVQWAEGLILQLPETHDGRNSWLMNYGTGEFSQELRRRRGLSFNEQSQAVNPPAPAQCSADIETLWGAFNAAHDAVSQTEPIKARRAGFDAIVRTLGAAQAAPQAKLLDLLITHKIGLYQLLAALHEDDPKRELLVRVGDLMRETDMIASSLSSPEGK